MNVINEANFLEVSLNVLSRAATRVSEDCIELLKKAHDREGNKTARKMLNAMIRNSEMASKQGKSVCQSPGYPVVYLTLGKEFCLDFAIRETLTDLFRSATEKNLLRPSMVHPITRKNTGNNTGFNVPNFEIEVNPRLDFSEIIISLKGCGAELFDAVKVFTPAQIGRNGEGIKRFILETIVDAGGGPCPPGAVGIGMGGQIDQAARLSRRAVSIRRWDDTNPNVEFAKWEKELLKKANSLGIGPAGLGGDTTVLAVKIEFAYTHTAILPVVVNFHCWPARRARAHIYPDGSTKTIGW